MSCYDKIIGLSPTINFNCLPMLPTAMQGSKSGLYLSDLGVLDLIANDMSQPYIWDELDKAVKQAALFFTADTNALLQRKVSYKHLSFAGKIGEPNARASANTSRTYTGIRVACQGLNGSVLELRELELMFDTDFVTTIHIKNRNNQSVYYNDNVVVANGRAVVNVNLSLPTHDQMGAMDYFIYYESQGNSYKNNRLVCSNCNGFAPVFNKANPHFNKGHRAGNAWANWLMIQGVDFDDDTYFDDFDSISSEKMDNAAKGIVLNINIGCRIDTIMCNEVQNFSINPFAMSIAKAIQLKAAELFTTMLLSTQKISRTTMINNEQITAMRQEWRQEYNNEIIPFITSNIEVSDNDCFHCKGFLDIRISSILS